MTFAVQLFIISLVAGLLLIGAEIFVPGGVLGVVGGLALIVALIVGFVAFPGYGLYVAVGILILVGVAIFLWIKLFPNSRMGRKMTVMHDMSSSKATEDGLAALLGKEGEALSELRPAGFALIEGRRVDVVAEGRMIATGTKVRVIEVEGNRVIVAKI